MIKIASLVKTLCVAMNPKNSKTYKFTSNLDIFLKKFHPIAGQPLVNLRTRNLDYLLISTTTIWPKFIIPC